MNLKKVLVLAIMIGFFDLKISKTVGLFTSKSAYCTVQKEIEKVVSLLCYKFKIRNDITVKILDKSLVEHGLMYYCPGINLIVVRDDYKDIPLSVSYANLLHEFRHYIQSENKVLARRTGKEKIKIFYDQRVLEKSAKMKTLLWFPDDAYSSLFSLYYPKNEDEKKYVQNIKKIYNKYPDSLIFKPVEFDAELFTIQNITCPICYEILLQTEFRTNISPEGYVGFKYMQKYRQGKQQNPCCKAHSCNDDVVHNNKVKKLKNLLYGSSSKVSHSFSRLSLTDREKICDLDNACGALSHHHIK